MHVHALHILLLTWPRFMRAWITRLPYRCPSVVPPWRILRHAPLSVCAGAGAEEPCWRLSQSQTYWRFPHFDIQGWLLPRQVLAHPTAERRGARRRWRGGGGEKTRRHNWLSFFLLHWSCEKGRIYNTYALQDFQRLSSAIYHTSRGQMFMHFVYNIKNMYF